MAQLKVMVEEMKKEKEKYGRPLTVEATVADSDDNGMSMFALRRILM